MTAGETGRRIPTLDGIRALSIALVLLDDLFDSKGFPVPRITMDVGDLGVRIFFVLSGFLITSLLISERAKKGTIDIGAFYLRRAFRILPAFFAYALVVLIASRAGLIEVPVADWAYALTFTMNYHFDRGWYLSHVWSLSVEEQFYLAWPLGLRVLGPRVGFGAATAFLVLAPLVRVLTWTFLPGQRDGIATMFQTVGDAIAAGCVLAAVRPLLERSALYARVQRSPAFALVPLLVLAASWAHKNHPLPDYLVGQTVMNVGIALTIDRSIRHAAGAVGRVLDSAPFVLVGQMSYSLYLWQRLFLNHGSAALLHTFPLNLGCAVLCATICHFAIEKPMLRVKERLRDRRNARCQRRAM